MNAKELTEDDDIAQARETVDRLRGQQRREHFNRGEGTILVAPGCPKGCDICSRECAVTTILLRVWEDELTRLTPTNVIPFPSKKTGNSHGR